MSAETSAANGLVFHVRTLAPGRSSAEERRVWKSMVDTSVRTGAPLSLQYEGAANAITSYRVFYMLQYAKDAGVRRLSCHLRTGHWTADAKEWLRDSPADANFIDAS